MSQVSTFDANFAKQTAIETQLSAPILRHAQAGWDRLQHLASTLVGDTGRSNSQPLSTYYADAYDRARASAPLTSTRDTFGS